RALQCGFELVDDLLRLVARRGHGPRGQAFVDGQAFFEQLAQLGTGVADQKGAGRVHTDPLGRLTELDVEIDHMVIGQVLLCVLVQDGATADRDHTFPRTQSLGDHLACQGTKMLLTVLDEDVTDRLARALLDLGVGAQQIHTEPSGQRLTDGRLARTGCTDDHRDRFCHALPTSGYAPAAAGRCLGMSTSLSSRPTQLVPGPRRWASTTNTCVSITLGAAT